MADSLTIHLLKDLGRTRPIGAVRLAGFGGTGLPALKAFLQGEQHHRRSEWDSALAYYQRAIDIDSTFAPALRRASTARGWIHGFDSMSYSYAFRAGANNHGLPPRDSLLIVADALLASLLEAGPLAIGADTAWTPRLRSLLATQEYATTRYPDDPEAWFLLGDVENHLGAFAGRSYEQQLQAFDRAIALDSAYVPSYIHTIQTSAVHGPDAMRRYLRPYLAIAANDPSAEGARLVQRLLDSAPGGADLTALLRGVSDPGLFYAANSLSWLPDSAELCVNLFRFIAARPGFAGPIDDSNFVKFQMARALMSRGHLREAQEFLGGQEQWLGYGEAALLGAVPEEQAAAAFRERLSGQASHLLVAAFPWWASHRDTASLRRAENRADSLARLDPDPNGRARARYAAASAAAYLALARKDTAGALGRFLALPDGACPACYLDRFTLAQLLADRRRDREAWRILQAEHPSSTLAPYATEVLWVLLRGRVAERLGERDRAAQSYAWVAGMWRNPDSALQPYVREAREGLARLTGERP